MIHGLDISAFQSVDVLSTVPVVDFAFVKATEGKDYTNSRFARQWASAATREKHRGGYHFARPEQSSYKDQLARFLDVVRPHAGESVMLDLEASKLTQAQTNTWARGWGDLMREQAPGITSILYMGRGYATNGTGRDLDQHFDFWMYPQYPSAFLLRRLRHAAMRARGTHPRSVDAGRRRRLKVARTTTLWPTSFTPSLPSGLTCGWKTPHIWQYTDNFHGLDASVSTLTVDQLAGHKPVPAPIPKPPSWPGRYLHYKVPLMHGSDVKWVQQRLNAHGWKLAVDGKYGKHTRDAVKTFQGHHGLVVDGEVGPKTWGALAK